jgi:RNA ligase (TIGR02306 family)
MYNATVCEVKEILAHPNADKIQLAKVMGEQVVVGLGTQVGDVGIYFPPDGQLSHEFTLAHNLYTQSALTKLGLTNPKVGFFEHNRRIKAQKFRGQKSEGFWMPLRDIDVMFNPSALSLGTTLTELNGIPVCNKYITSATRNATTTSSRKVKRGETPTFPKHYDTEQFRHKWEDIPDGSLIYLTEKLHGTSGRYGYTFVDEAPSSLLGKIAAKVLAYFNYSRHNWNYLMGSRNVILEHSNGTGFYGSDDFRYEHIKDVKLHKGEVIFFELVGSIGTTPIMPSVKVDKKELPDIFKQYGPELHYTYGTQPGTSDLYVYRIVQFTEDGDGIDLPWPQVKKRCSQLGLKHVPELLDKPITVNSIIPYHIEKGMEWEFPTTIHTWSLKNLKDLVELYSHGPSLLDAKHIREGVGIRIETPTGTIYTLKEKSFEFKLLEGIVKSNDTYIDIEEAS